MPVLEFSVSTETLENWQLICYILFLEHQGRPTQGGTHMRQHISNFPFRLFQNSATSITCFILHPSQWFVLISSLTPLSFGKNSPTRSLLKKIESLLQENLLKLFLGEARLREFVSLFRWLYLPWALLLCMDNLSAGFLGLMQFKEYFLTVSMPLAAWLFSLPYCVWHRFYVLFHLSHLKKKHLKDVFSPVLSCFTLLVGLLSFFGIFDRWLSWFSLVWRITCHLQLFYTFGCVSPFD